MEIQGRTLPEFKHMFEAGYIKGDLREVVQELIDYIGDDHYEMRCLVATADDEKDELQKENRRLTQDINDEWKKNEILREQLRGLTSAITTLSETSRKFVSERVELRSY